MLDAPPRSEAANPRPPQSRGAFGRGLLALPAITALPVLIFAIAIVAFLAREQQQGVEYRLIQISRASLQASELLLAAQTSTVDALAALVEIDDLNGFGVQAQRLLDTRPEWLKITLERPDGSLTTFQQQESLRTLPMRLTTPEGQSAATAVVVVGEGSHDPFLLLTADVEVRGQPGLIRAALDLAPYSEALSEQIVPEGWVAALLDPAKIIAGRSRNPAEHVGSRATPSLVSQINSAAESFFYALNQEGDRVYTAFTRSAESGWTAAVGAPAALVEAPLRRTQLMMIGGGALAVVLAALLAWLLTRNVLRRQDAERAAMEMRMEKQEENRLSDVAAHFPGIIYRRIMTPDGRVYYSYLSSSVATLIGDEVADFASAPRTLAEIAQKYIPAGDQERMREILVESAKNLAPYDAEGRVIRSDGTTRWLRSIASTRKGPDDTIIWDGVMLDVTALKEAEHALKARTGVLQTINRVNMKIAGELDLDHLVQGVLDAARDVSGAAFAAFFYNLKDDEGESYTLYKLSGADPDEFSKFPMPRNTGIFGPTFRGEGIIRLDDVTKDERYGKNAPHKGMPKGHLPVRSYLAVPVISLNGTVVGGLFFGHPETGIFTEDSEQIIAGIAAQTAVAMDNARLFREAEQEIARRTEVEAHQKMLLDELNHRVKNTLAVVIAIAHQTAKSSDSLERFSDVYRGRLLALANAHSLLTESSWGATPLVSLIHTALEPYSGVEEGRVTIAGPEVIVPPKQALALSLVFHELATNASKYGALAVSDGTIEITWAPAEDEAAICLRWREAGGRSVDHPATGGFGSKLIDLNITYELGGSIRRDSGPDGFSCEISMPWDKLSGQLTPEDSSRAEASNGAESAAAESAGS